MSQEARAQLVMPFNPGMPQAPETKLSHALAQWRSLNTEDRESAVLIVVDAAGKRQVYAGSDIAGLHTDS